MQSKFDLVKSEHGGNGIDNTVLIRKTLSNVITNSLYRKPVTKKGTTDEELKLAISDAKESLQSFTKCKMSTNTPIVQKCINKAEEGSPLDSNLDKICTLIKKNADSKQNEYIRKEETRTKRHFVSDGV